MPGDAVQSAPEGTIQGLMSNGSDLATVVEGAKAAPDPIPVHISYEIIRLFSEGLYQSPHKAIEELVSNSYDARASAVHILLPREPETADEVPPLWVVDNGTGMDAAGFGHLWRVADSRKADADDSGARPPIGQFGIGKLAAYVLAWRLTHISKVGDAIRATSMNFRNLTELHQYESTDPFNLRLYELTIDQARKALADIEERDAAAWQLMFGAKAANTWTAAALSDFRELYDKLAVGRLKWVLSTGLPLRSTFKIFVDGERLESSKVSLEALKSLQLGVEDEVAADLGLEVGKQGIVIPGIPGEITGDAVIFKKKLTEGKSDQYSRSHGFFVRVRGRVINLEDELFGLDALNHAAWARFSMEIRADGLRAHLLSSREGVRQSDSIDTLRKYLHGVFNACRRAYDDWADKELEGIDLEALLSDAPSLFVTEPMVSGVRELVETERESYYLALPEPDAAVSSQEWLTGFIDAVSETPISKVLYESTGPYDRMLRFIPDTRTLVMNTDHPFVDKLLSGGRTRAAATLVGSAELFLDLLLHENGIGLPRRIEVLADRDRVLRVLAGDEPPTATEVLRLLDVANQSEIALERAVGAAFKALGFEYERRGGSTGGTDGVLYARLGRGSSQLADYKIVYDAKQTNEPAVPADKINPGSLEDFRVSEGAEFAFFFAAEYQAQDKLDGKLNRVIDGITSARVKKGERPQPITLLRIDDLRRIVLLHYRYGVPLTRLRSLFSDTHRVPEVRAWIDALENELGELEPQVPIRRLLLGLEAAKTDTLARPNIKSVRIVDDGLKPFTPERLTAALAAVQEVIGKRWIEVDQAGDVVLHHTAPQIAAEVERAMGDMFGINSVPLDRSDEG